MKQGDLFTSNSGHQCRVVKVISGRKVVITFINTGTTKEVYVENLLKGKVRDEYEISIYNVGYLGFRDPNIDYYIKGGQLWRNMLKRCYSEKDTKGYAGVVVVEPRWHCLATFLEDLPKLENFDKWLNYNGKGCKYQLDKDINGDGTVYSLSTCKFITEFENKSLGAINARAWDSRYGRSKPENKIYKRDLAGS